MWAILRHTSRSGAGWSFDLYEFPGGDPAKLNDAPTNRELRIPTSRAHAGACHVKAPDRDAAARWACAQYGVEFEGWLD